MGLLKHRRTASRRLASERRNAQGVERVCPKVANRRLCQDGLPVVLWIACCLSGCGLFTEPTATNSVRSILKPLTPSVDSLQFDFFTVERPADDPLMSETLWKDVDQVGALPADSRRVLHQHGFRLGLVGPTPPAMLQSVLALASVAGPDAEKNTGVSGRMITLLSGAESLLELSPRLRPITMDSGDEQASPREFANARGVLVLRPSRLQDGWVKLDLAPEIHFGASQLRPVAANEGWRYRGGQEIHVLPDLRFAANVNQGDSLVLGARHDVPGSLGGQMLSDVTDAGRPLRRLLVIRVAKVARLDPL